jgi:hypothetical protein
VRVIGNFAAHPIKSTNTGEVVAVEPGEAEFLLDVLDGVFGFYFVQPEVARKQREAINIKLQEAGKPRLRPSGRVAKPSGPRRKGVRTAGFLFRLETRRASRPSRQGSAPPFPTRRSETRSRFGVGRFGWLARGMTKRTSRWS